MDTKSQTIISYWNCKGGTGKTSLSILTALYLSENYKVLMSDLDSQKSLTIFFEGVEKENLCLGSLSQAKNYDFVLVDCPPYMTPEVKEAILQSDKIFLPMLLSQFDFESTKRTINDIKAIKDTEICLLLNRVGKNETEEEKEYLSFYNFKYPIVRIPQSTEVKRVIDSKKAMPKGLRETIQTNTDFLIGVI